MASGHLILVALLILAVGAKPFFADFEDDYWSLPGNGYYPPKRQPWRGRRPEGRLSRRWGYDPNANPFYYEDYSGEGEVVDDRLTEPPQRVDITRLKKGVNPRRKKEKSRRGALRNFRTENGEKDYSFLADY